MRFVQQIIHLLIGLLAIALIAAAAGWVWPSLSSRIWLLAYAVMAGHVLWELIGMLRNRNGENGENCG